MDIKCICQDENDTVTHIGIPNSGPGKDDVLILTPQEVHDKFQNVDLYIVYGGKRTKLKVVTNKETHQFEFYRTEANNTEHDNLAKLIHCKDCEADS